MSVLDFLHIGSSTSLRSFARFGPLLPILDCVALGLPMSAQSPTHLGFPFLVFSRTSSDFSMLLLDPTAPGFSLLARSVVCLGFVLFALDFAVLGFFMLLQSCIWLGPLLPFSGRAYIGQKISIHDFVSPEFSLPVRSIV